MSNPNAAALVCEHITKIYPSRNGSVSALQDVSLEVGQGEFVSVVGPSGCGKSTLLKIIAGLVSQTAGDLTFGPSPAAGPHNALVFQEHGLLPWLTVLDNVALGLEMQGIPRGARRERAAQFLAQVGLDRFARHYPNELSVGMRQRAAIARAFLTDPQVLLMDEPFSALDAQSKLVLQEELLRIWKDFRKTVVFVTHDIDEAVMLADRVVVMSGRPGRILQQIPIPLRRPRDLHDIEQPGDQRNYMAHLESNRRASAPEFVASRLTLPALRLPSLSINWLPPVLVLLVLLAWEAGVRLGFIAALLFPAPSTIASTTLELLRSGLLLGQTAATVGRVALGVLLGGGAGIVLGLFMGWSRPLRVAADPFVAAAYAIPKIAILPLIMLVFGIGESSKIAIAFTGAFFPLLINTLVGVRQINPIYYEVAANYGAQRGKLFWRVLLPGSLPWIMSGMRIAVNTTLLLTIAVEMISIDNGLGAMIWQAWETMRTEELFTSLLVIVLLGIGSNILLQQVSRRVLPWQPEQQD